MNVGRKISRVTDTEKQQAETYRYWRSLSIGERLSAVWDVSEAACSFATAFKENLTNDAQRSLRTQAPRALNARKTRGATKMATGDLGLR